MKMVGRIMLVAFALVLLSGMSTWAESERTVYLVVAPGTAESGDYEAALFEFKRELAVLGGGYTQMGQTFGATYMDDAYSSSSNMTFIVASTEDIQAAIIDLTKKHFGKGPFILSWPATCNY